MSGEDETVSTETNELTALNTAIKLRLTRPHPLIQRTLNNKATKDQWGNIQPPAWPGVDIRVSKSAKRDALIMLDRLFKALGKHDVEVSVEQGGYRANGTFAVRGGYDKVQVYVTEENKKVPHVATEKELRHKAEYPYSARIPKYDSVPTGKLTLVPGGVADLSSEDALAKLIAIAVEDIVLQLDESRRRREVAEVERKREQDRQQAEREEKARVEALHKAGPPLRRYREIMDYIEEVRRSGRVPNDQRKQGQTLDEWLKWAEREARRIHPLG